jgi:selenocysteine lyase/cysteine desulfurase
MNSLLAESYRREFPVTDTYVYLDHAGIAPLSLRARRAVEILLKEATEGGAFHYPAWAERVMDSRLACAELIHAGPEEIAFVKSTSHGLSIVANGLDWQEGDNLLIYEKEFPSNIYPWLNLQRRGVRVKTIPSREGRVVLEDIDHLIDSRTRLLAISSVQFSNGFRIDLQQIGDLCKQRNVLFCVDAIQSLGILLMDVKKYHIDFLSADAHKWLLGPEGVGIFYCRRELCERLSPPLVGWKSVQNELDFDHPRLLLKSNALKFEEGSLNLMGIFGLRAALGLLAEVGIGDIRQRVLDLGDFIIHEAEKRGYAVLTPRARDERGGNITISGPFDPVALKDSLRNKGIMVNARGGGLRVSPHFYNTEDELIHLFSTMDSMLPGS